MPNNNRYPGIKLENAASVADLPPVQQPPRRSAQPGYYRPRAQRTAQPPAQNEETAQRESRSTQIPEIPFAWFFKPVGKRHKAAPARRAILIIIGFAVGCFSSFLSMLALAHYVPAFKNTQNLTPGAAVAGLAATLILAGVELMVFRTFGFSWWTILLVSATYLVDVWINLDGTMRLFGFDNLLNNGLGTALIFITGCGAAYLPEKFIAAGWGDD